MDTTELQSSLVDAVCSTRFDRFKSPGVFTEEGDFRIDRLLVEKIVKEALDARQLPPGKDSPVIPENAELTLKPGAASQLTSEIAIRTMSGAVFMDREMKEEIGHREVMAEFERRIRPLLSQYFGGLVRDSNESPATISVSQTVTVVEICGGVRAVRVIIDTLAEKVPNSIDDPELLELLLAVFESVRRLDDNLDGLVLKTATAELAAQNSYVNEKAKMEMPLWRRAWERFVLDGAGSVGTNVTAFAAGWLAGQLYNTCAATPLPGIHHA